MWLVTPDATGRHVRFFAERLTLAGLPRAEHLIGELRHVNGLKHDHGRIVANEEDPSPRPRLWIDVDHPEVPFAVSSQRHALRAQGLELEPIHAGEGHSSDRVVHEPCRVEQQIASGGWYGNADTTAEMLYARRVQPGFEPKAGKTAASGAFENGSDIIHGYPRP